MPSMLEVRVQGHRFRCPLAFFVLNQQQGNPSVLKTSHNIFIFDASSESLTLFGVDITRVCPEFECDWAWPSVTAPLPLLSRQYSLKQCPLWDEEILG